MFGMQSTKTSVILPQRRHVTLGPDSCQDNHIHSDVKKCRFMTSFCNRARRSTLLEQHGAAQASTAQHSSA